MIETLAIVWVTLFVYSVGFLVAHLEPRAANVGLLKAKGIVLVVIGVFLVGSLF